MLSSIEFGKKQFSVLWADSPALGGSLRLKLNEFSCANAHIGVDTETTGLDVVEDRIRLVQLCCQDSIIVVDLFGWWGAGYRDADWSSPELAELKKLLESKIPKVLQNSPFDISMFSAIGVSLGGPIFDTMMAAKIINAGTGAPNDLGAIVKRELGRALTKEMQKARWGDTITGEMAEYAARDTAVLPLLVEPLRDKLVKSKVSSKVTLFDIFRLEMMVVRATASMRFNGFGFDAEAAKSVQVQLKQEADVLEHKFIVMLDQLLRKRHHKDPTKWLPRDPDGTLNLRKRNSGRGAAKLLAGFNPNSPVQMVRALVDSGIELPVRDPRKGGKKKTSDTSTPYTLDQNLLAFLRADYPIIDAYMTWKTQATLVSHIATLINAVSSDGRIHASYNQLGTNTGRYSASDPNLQQVPRSEFFRKLFIPRPGYVILGGDFSQIELRVAAELSEEPRMIQAYNDGRDLHMETACLLTGKTADQITKQERTNAKICFSGDTEILTPNGWVRLDSYSGEEVAQYVLPAGVALNYSVPKPDPGYVAAGPCKWDGSGGEIQFVKPLDYRSFWSDDVWRAQDRNFSVVATGNHEILYVDAYGNAKKQSLVDVVAPRLFIAAGNTRQSEYKLGSLFSRVLAMVVADGSFKSAAGWVSLGFSKRRKVHRCKSLLDEAGIQYTKNTYTNGDHGKSTFFKFRLSEAEWLLNYTTVDKELNMSTCLTDVDPYAYLGEAQYWDGTALTGDRKDRIIVTTIVRQTADVMQAMAVTSGIACTIHDYEYDTNSVAYRVSYAFRGAPVWRPTWEPTKALAQNVYCVQVPSSLILIRHEGKVCIQGNCNFGLIFGAGAATLRRQAMAQFGVSYTLGEARELVKNFREAYPTLYQWQQTYGSLTTTSVYTRYGRRRILTGFDDKYTTRLNTPVQGTAGDIAKIAIAGLWPSIVGAPEGEVFIVSVVHDELVLEVREERAEFWKVELKREMEAAGGTVLFKVPVLAEVNYGPSWGDAK